MSDTKPEPKREGTMKTTSKEGEQYLKEVWNYTPSWSKGSSSSSGSGKKEDNTESNQKGQVSAENTDGNGAVEGPVAKKAKLVKDHTMVETATTGKKFLGKEVLEETRSATRAIRDTAKVSLKRLGTMAKTAQEGEALLKDLGYPEEGGKADKRQTRSQTRGGNQQSPSSQKKTPTRESTRQSRRGGPQKDDQEESSEENEDDADQKELKSKKREDSAADSNQD
ncbi:nucleolin 1-like isoform X1 [Limulus polyphemus]|uniref:Nucleolin 1-like isoform X1 n=1 Tax=Limulus polyphemus TaxID=6850 RepID=A0ABM1BZ42_LIMPO|nr:nucleolin 1-like isoform X1 [Limulus polyphemus]